MRRSREQFIVSPKKSQQPKRPQEVITVAILGENHGYRMKSYGPISLINLHGKTLLEKQINTIKSAYQNYEIIICTGFETDKIGNYIREKYPLDDIRMVENQIYLNSNCCESTRLCVNNTLNQRMLIMGGGIEIVPAHLEMLSVNQTSVVVQPQSSDSNFEVGCIIVDGNLSHLTYGVGGHFWTEMIFLHGRDTIDLFQRIVSDSDFKNKFLFEAINNLAEKREVSVVVNHEKRINKVDNLKSLRKSMKI